MRWLGLAGAMMLPTALAWFALIHLTRHFPADSSRETSPNGLAVGAYAAGKIVQFALPVGWVWWVERRPIQLRRPHFRGFGTGIAFGLAACVGIWCVYRFLATETEALSIVGEGVRVRVQEFGLDSPGKFLIFGVFLSTVHSLAEEYYWRWFVFGELRQSVPLAAAIVLSAAAFMAHHVIVLAGFFPGYFWTLALPLSLCVGIGGAAWAWLYARTGSLYAAWISHLLVDAAIFAAGYVLIFG